MDSASIFVTRLRVDIAYHSHHLELFASKYLRGPDEMEFREPAPSINFISLLTARTKTSGFGPNHWVTNLTPKICFREALENYCRKQQRYSQSSLLSNKEIFIEIRPHSTLAGPVRQIMAHVSSLYASDPIGELLLAASLRAHTPILLQNELQS